MGGLVIEHHVGERDEENGRDARDDVDDRCQHQIEKASQNDVAFGPLLEVLDQFAFSAEEVEEIEGDENDNEECDGDGHTFEQDALFVRFLHSIYNCTTQKSDFCTFYSRKRHYLVYNILEERKSNYVL